MAGIIASNMNLTGTFTATGNGGSAQVQPGHYNVSIWGTFVGTVVLERSFDSGTTWIPRNYDYSGTAVSFTAPASIEMHEHELGVLVRVRCSAYTSGTVNYRISE